MEHAEHPIYSYLKVPRAPSQAVAFSGAVRANTTELRVFFGSLVIQIIRSDLVSDFRPAGETWNDGSSLVGRPLHGLSDSQVSSSCHFYRDVRLFITQTNFKHTEIKSLINTTLECYSCPRVALEFNNIK